MNALQLAKYYSCSPTEFLKMPVSEVEKYWHWTTEMLKRTDRSRPPQ